MPTPSVEIDLRPLCVPWDSVAKVACGPIDAAAVAGFSAQRFDQVAVVDGDRPLGVVRTGRLRRLLSRGKPLRPDTKEIRKAFVAPRLHLDLLLEHLEESTAVIVQHGDGAPHGLFATCDLNRHEFRAVLYPMLADLERRLAEQIERRFCEQKAFEWIKCLPTYRQIAIHGGWALARRNRVETTPAACASLSDLLKAAERHDEVRAPLVQESGKDWSCRIKRVNDLRNRVMHPARPLLENSRRKAVASLREDLRSLLQLVPES